MDGWQFDLALLQIGWEGTGGNRIGKGTLGLEIAVVCLLFDLLLLFACTLTNSGRERDEKFGH